MTLQKVDISTADEVSGGPDTDHQALLVVRKEVFIQASSEEAWRVLVDIDAWPRWQPGVSRAKLEGPLAVGSIFRWRAGLTLVSTLQVVESNRCIEWTGTGLGMQVRHRWMFRPQGDGSLVTTDEVMSGWLLRIVKIVKPDILETVMERALQALKREVERINQSRKSDQNEDSCGREI